MSGYRFQAVYFVLYIWYFVFPTHESSVLATMVIHGHSTSYLRLPEDSSPNTRLFRFYWTAIIVVVSSKAIEGGTIESVAKYIPGNNHKQKECGSFPIKVTHKEVYKVA